jgi:hypothetical protein
MLARKTSPSERQVLHPGRFSAISVIAFSFWEAEGITQANEAIGPKNERLQIQH